MQLSHLIAAISPLHTWEFRDQEITGLSFDSRRVAPGHLFVAVRGTQTDGHHYLTAAVDAGAVAIVRERSESGTPQHTSPGVVEITVDDTARALGLLAAEWYGQPSKSLRVVGVTGTNGKTTVTTLLHDLFTALGYKAGLLSTVEVRIGRTTKSATHTTPDALAIQSALAEMVHEGVDYVFMEVSSHAVHQQRIAGLVFVGAVFTNLTHDHLDYHGTFDNYISAKKAFFDGLPAAAFALINADDKRGSVMVQNTAATVHRYSLRTNVDVHARLIANTPEGLQLAIGGTEVFFKLLGRFNAYNLLAAYGTAMLLGQDERESLIALSALPGAEGRLQHVADPSGRVTALVDYAHTPDALDNVLTTLRALLPDGHRLCCVVGAGGDRDRSKRPEMARVAARIADQVILTSDNPRSEDPEAILDEMEAGLTTGDLARVLRITDRRQAIRTAVRMGFELILLAGKGHETYQEVKGERLPFDDRTELSDALKQLARAN